MKQRNGFTLIELLAVIVILAIIALIATPMILGVIDSAKKGAAESSAYGYIEAIENSTLQNMVETHDTTLVDGKYKISSNGTTLTLQNAAGTGAADPVVTIKVNFKGDNPKGDADVVEVTGGKISKATLTINGFTVTYDGTRATDAK